MSEVQTREVSTKTSGNGVASLMSSPMIKSRFEEVLGKKSPAFVSSVITAVNGNKALGECTPMTVISSALVAASLDLPINASLGFAHIVPYKQRNGTSEAQFQIGWKGIVQLAMRSGQYLRMNVTSVLEGQIKKINRFTGEIEFQDEAVSSKVIGYLLYFKLLNGYERFHYMTYKEAFDHGKKYSKSFARGYGPWVDDFDSMALKTVVKMGLGKYGVLSVEMQTAMEVDQAVVDEAGSPALYPDNPVEAIAEPKEATPAQVEAAKPKNFAPKNKEEAIAKAKEINAKLDAEALEKAKVKEPEAPQVQDAEVVSEEESAPPAKRTRTQLLGEIKELKAALKLADKEFNQLILDCTGKTDKTKLTDDDLMEIGSALEIKLFQQQEETV